MATESVNYQCPSCMGPLHFEGADGKLHCDYCGGAFTPAEVEAAYAAKQQEADAKAENDTERAEAGERSDFERMGDEAAGAASVLTNETISAAKEVSASASDPIQAYLSRASWNEDEREGMRSFMCSSCGAAVTVDATTAVSECPYCGNPAVVPGTFSNEAKPDFIIPFKVSKEEATSALTSYYKGKKFLPKEFVQSNRIAHMQGVYVPFWLYDGNAEGSATYECKNIRVYTSGDEEVTETDVYEAYREGSLDFERIPADSSAKMPDAHMDAIEPFDFDELVPFSVAYLPGYLAERYDQEADTCQPRAMRRMKGSLEDELQATVTGYDDVTQESINANSEVTGLSQAFAHALQGRGLPVRHERPDRALHRRLAGVAFEGGAVVFGNLPRVHGDLDWTRRIGVPVRRRAHERACRFWNPARHRDLRVHRLLQSDEDGPRADRRAGLHHDGRAHAHRVQ